MSVTANLTVENSQVQEGNYAHFTLTADTDHDWAGTPTLAVTMYFGDGTNEQFSMQAGQTEEIYHAYQEAQNYSMNVEAFVHDDGVFTYGIGPDDDTPYTQVGVYDAPLTQVDVENGFFDESDEGTPIDQNSDYDTQSTTPPTKESQNTTPTTVARFYDGVFGGTNVFVNTPGDFTAQIDWGDGTAPTQGTVNWDASTLSYTVTGFHDYHGPNPNDPDGIWHSTTRVTDDDGASNSFQGNVFVHAGAWININRWGYSTPSWTPWGGWGVAVSSEHTISLKLNPSGKYLLTATKLQGWTSAPNPYAATPVATITPIIPDPVKFPPPPGGVIIAVPKAITNPGPKGPYQDDVQLTWNPTLVSAGDRYELVVYDPITMTAGLLWINFQW